MQGGRVIPSPAALAQRRGPAGPVRLYPLPPVLGSRRCDDGLYVLDTGVGLAFGAVDGGLDMLAEHFDGRLCWVDAVQVELEGLAERKVWHPGAGADGDAIEAYQRRLRARAAAAPAAATLPELLGAPVALSTAEDLDAIDKLIDALCELPKPKQRDPLGDRGECASVRHAMKVRYGPQALPPAAGIDAQGLPKVIVCVNDDRGRRLAIGRGIAARSAADVLREIVGAGRFDADRAWAMYQAMAQVTTERPHQQPRGPDFFML